MSDGVFLTLRYAPPRRFEWFQLLIPAYNHKETPFFCILKRIRRSLSLRQLCTSADCVIEHIVEQAAQVVVAQGKPCGTPSSASICNAASRRPLTPSPFKIALTIYFPCIGAGRTHPPLRQSSR